MSKVGAFGRPVGPVGRSIKKLVRIGLHWFALVALLCIGLHWFALVCIGLHRLCVGLALVWHWFALVCIGLYWFPFDSHWFALVRIGFIDFMGLYM
jgi:hypothetical protein